MHFSQGSNGIVRFHPPHRVPSQSRYSSCLQIPHGLLQIEYRQYLWLLFLLLVQLHNFFKNTICC